MGGVHELPSKQMDYVGRSGGDRPDCARRGVRLARRRDALILETSGIMGGGDPARNSLTDRGRSVVWLITTPTAL